jgi:hypothetical protein
MSAPLSLALAFYPALRAPPARRFGFFVAVVLLSLPIPLIIPPAARFLRLLAATWSVVVIIKLYDLHRGALVCDRPTPGQFLEFLPNIYTLVHRKINESPRPTLREELSSALRNAGLVATALVPLVVVFRADWSGRPFALEHTAKVVTFFLALIPLTAVAASLWRLFGGRAHAFMDNPFAARTPADFWRRYNRPVHQFLQEDVFKPFAGVRHPVRATVAAFVVSAFIHEFVFTVAVGRIQGYQTAFFLLQGLAVAATSRIKPRGWRAAVWTAGTFAFNLGTGVLFFGSVNEKTVGDQTAGPSRDPRRSGGW